MRQDRILLQGFAGRTLIRKLRLKRRCVSISSTCQVKSELPPMNGRQSGVLEFLNDPLDNLFGLFFARLDADIGILSIER